MEYQKLLFENESIHLMANFTWITDDIANAETIKLCFYTYQKWTWRQVFSETLEISQLRGLYDHLNAVSIIKDATRTTTERFVEASDDIIAVIQKLESIEANIIRIILDKFQEDSRIIHILSVLTEIEAENLVAAHKYKKYRDELDNLIELLEIERTWDLVSEVAVHPILIKYIAGQPEMIFQKWIEQNLWIFWVEYIAQYPFRDIVPPTDAEGGSTADLVMQSMDGFLELIELKRAKYDIFKSDHSHHCYRPSKDLSIVLWQSLFYLQKLDEYKIYLETQNPDIQILRPRVKIILWRSDGFTTAEHKALRMLNSNLSHIEVITYDHLIKCWELLLAQYADNE